MITKKCLNCKETKLFSEFHKSRKSKDGLQSSCKSCQRAYQKTEKGKVAHRKGVAKYQKTEKGKATQKRHRKTVKGKVNQRAKQKRFNARHPNQTKARHAVNNAIKDSRITHPDTLQCHYCPEQAQQYHHWHGYAPEHWLDVIAVCTRCHQKYKRKIAG